MRDCSSGYAVGYQIHPSRLPLEFTRCAAGCSSGSPRSDGGPVTQQGRTCRIQFTTVSDRLRDDVTFLVQSLGGVVTTKGATSRITDRRHILDIRLPEGVVPFRLARKAAKYDATGGGRPMRFVDRIEPAGTEEAVCIQVRLRTRCMSPRIPAHAQHPQRRVHHSRRGAEHHRRADEDVPDPLGFGSKVVVTGDITQVDLPGGAASGLRAAVQILDGIDDIHFAELTSADVVRHRLVSEIVDAYAKVGGARPDEPGAAAGLRRPPGGSVTRP